MATLAECFNAVLPKTVEGMIAAVIRAGGGEWGEGTNDYIVSFNDGSYWSGAVFYPQDDEPYYNGSPKTNP